MVVSSTLADELVWKNESRNRFREIGFEEDVDEQNRTEHKTNLAISMKCSIVVAKSTFQSPAKLSWYYPARFPTTTCGVLTEGM